MIVACDLNNGIGKDNALLCHLPADLKYFKMITSGHFILMGRKTFESIGRPLPNRTNMVLSRASLSFPEGVFSFQTVDEAFHFAENQGAHELFVIGGGTLYTSLIETADRIYLTRIHHQFQADTFFPDLDPAAWHPLSSEYHASDSKNPYAYSFEVYDRKQIITDVYNKKALVG